MILKVHRVERSDPERREVRDWSRDALVASGAEEAARGRAVSMHKPEPFVSVNMTRLSGFVVWIESPGNTSKELDKNVVVRV